MVVLKSTKQPSTPLYPSSQLHVFFSPPHSGIVALHWLHCTALPPPILPLRYLRLLPRPPRRTIPQKRSQGLPIGFSCCPPFQLRAGFSNKIPTKDRDWRDAKIQPTHAKDKRFNQNQLVVHSCPHSSLEKEESVAALLRLHHRLTLQSYNHGFNTVIPGTFTLYEILAAFPFVH